MTEGRIILSEHADLATPYSLSLRRRDGKQPAAELSIEFAAGKGTRTVTADLDRAQLLVLAEKAIGAIRVLDRARSNSGQEN